MDGIRHGDIAKFISFRFGRVQLREVYTKIIYMEIIPWEDFVAGNNTTLVFPGPLIHQIFDYSSRADSLISCTIFEDFSYATNTQLSFSLLYLLFRCSFLSTEDRFYARFSLDSR